MLFQVRHVPSQISWGLKFTQGVYISDVRVPPAYAWLRDGALVSPNVVPGPIMNALYRLSGNSYLVEASREEGGAL